VCLRRIHQSPTVFGRNLDVRVRGYALRQQVHSRLEAEARVIALSMSDSESKRVSFAIVGGYMRLAERSEVREAKRSSMAHRSNLTPSKELATPSIPLGLRSPI
jgi:hypothetical protein